MYPTWNTILMCVLRSGSKLKAKRVAVSMTLHGHTYKHNRAVSLFLTPCTHTHKLLFYMYFHSTSNLSFLSLGITTDSLSNYSSTVMFFINLTEFGVITCNESVKGSAFFFNWGGGGQAATPRTGPSSLTNLFCRSHQPTMSLSTLHMGISGTTSY